MAPGMAEEEPEPGGDGSAGQPQPGARPGLVSPEHREQLAGLRRTLHRVGSEVAEHASRKAQAPSEPGEESAVHRGPAAADPGSMTDPISSLWSQFGVASFPELHAIWSEQAADHRYKLSS